MIRLNKNYKEEPWSQIKFIVKSQGFEYRDFGTLKNLKIFGEIEKQGKTLKLNSQEEASDYIRAKSSVWNIMKHNVEKKFSLDVCFKFKRNKKGQIVKANQTSQKGEKVYQLSFVFQSLDSIKNHK